MKRFTFNLEKVLALKTHVEEIAKIEYAKILQKKVAREQEIHLCHEAIERTENATSSYIESKNGNVDYGLISTNDMYIESLRKKIEENRLFIDGLRPELEESEIRLRKAMSERKMLERLKEKAYNTYVAECDREETEMLDEVSSNLYIHSGRGGGHD